MTTPEEGLAVADGSGFRGVAASDARHPGPLSGLVASGGEALRAAGRQVLLHGCEVDPDVIEPPPPGKIVCIGLNCADHSAESGLAVPIPPTVFARLASSLVGHGAPIVRPRPSAQLWL